MIFHYLKCIVVFLYHDVHNIIIRFPFVDICGHTCFVEFGGHRIKTFLLTDKTFLLTDIHCHFILLIIIIIIIIII